MIEPDGIGSSPGALVIEPDAASGDDSFTRRCVWFGFVVAFAAFVLVVKLPTHLGIEASLYDKAGRDYVWRIWWTPRHDIVSFGPNWFFDLLLFGLLACILAAS